MSKQQYFVYARAYRTTQSHFWPNLPLDQFFQHPPPNPNPSPQHSNTNPLFRLAFLVFAGGLGYIVGDVEQRQTLAWLSPPLADLVDEVVEFVEVLFLGVIRRCILRGADVHPVIVIAPLVTVLVVPLSTKGGKKSLWLFKSKLHTHTKNRMNTE